MDIPHTLSSPHPCIVRTQELLLFRCCLQEATTGAGSLVLLGGEMGVGKTTLVGQMQQEAAQHQIPILLGRGSDVLCNVPYGLWFSALAPLDPPAHPLAPLLQSPEPSTPVKLLTLFQRVETWLRDCTATGPLVVALEDLHEADKSSLDLLRLLAQHLATLPVVLLLTYRTEALVLAPEVSLTLPLLAREPRAKRVQVRLFQQEEVAALLRERYHLPPSDQRRLLSYLQEHAAGNALYLTELLRMLEEHDLCQQGDEQWSLRGLPGEQVPPLLRHLIAERLFRDTPEEHHLLQLAAVIGQVIPLDLWQAIGQISEERLWQVCELCQTRMLLDVLPEGRAVQFHHPLIRQVLLETLLMPKRRRWHQRIAEHLLAQARPDADALAFHFHEARDPRALCWLRRAAKLAFRWGAALTAANLYEHMLHEAYATLLDARERAILLLSISWLRRGAYPQPSLLLANEALQFARENNDAELLFHALACRTFLQHHLNATDAMQMDAHEALHTWQALSPREQLDGSIALPNPLGTFESFDLFGGMLYLLAHNGFFQQVITFAEPPVHYPPVCEDSRTTPARYTLAFALLYGALALAYSAQGKREEALDAYIHARRCYDEVGLYFASAISAQQELVWLTLPCLPDQVQRRIHLSDLANQRFQQDQEEFFLQAQQEYARLPLWYSQGRWREARQLAEALITTDEAERASKGMIRGFLGLLAFHQGEYEQAWRLICEVLPRGVESVPGQHHFFEAQMIQRLAIQLLCEEGRLEEARHWLEAHDRWLVWAGTVPGQAVGQLLWGCYYQLRQDSLRACTCVQEALRLSIEMRQPLIQLSAHRLQGQLARQEHRLHDARSSLSAAYRLAEACAFPYERALTLLEQAECETAMGQWEQAQTTLAEAQAIFEDLEAHPALAHCQRLAQRLATDKKPAQPPACPSLTAREREIVSLVAEGQSNQQIAHELCLSQGTIKRHLHNISEKLEACNRTQIVTIARQHGWLG